MQWLDFLHDAMLTRRAGDESLLPHTTFAARAGGLLRPAQALHMSPIVTADGEGGGERPRVFRRASNAHACYLATPQQS